MEATIKKTERPIIFSTPMVKAILEGRKTQTRRIVKGNFHPDTYKFRVMDTTVNVIAVPLDYADRMLGERVRCPYGKIGDLLWVRETFAVTTAECCFSGTDNVPLGTPMRFTAFKATFNGDKCPIGDRWKPSIHMPRTLSRITLEITNIKVQRLMEMTAADVKREGFPSLITEESHIEHFEQFEKLWDAINAKRGYSWASNPFVWVIEFKKV